MYACVTYDISSNRLRRYARKYCKKIGLAAIQKSVFAGMVSAALLREMETDVRNVLSPTDKFVIIPLDKPSFAALAGQTNQALLNSMLEKFFMLEL